MRACVWCVCLWCVYECVCVYVRACVDRLLFVRMYVRAHPLLMFCACLSLSVCLSVYVGKVLELCTTTVLMDKLSVSKFPTSQSLGKWYICVCVCVCLCLSGHLPACLPVCLHVGICVCAFVSVRHHRASTMHGNELTSAVCRCSQH